MERNVTDAIFFVELATTSSRAVVALHALLAGATHVTAGPETTLSLTFLKAVLGNRIAPTRFADWAICSRAVDTLASRKKLLTTTATTPDYDEIVRVVQLYIDGFNDD